MGKVINNLNTSNVIVNLEELLQLEDILGDLNTSNVIVNLYIANRLSSTY